MSEINEQIANLLAIGAAQGPVRTVNVDGAPFSIVPTGYKVMDLREFLAAPLRIKADAKFDEAGSFCIYVRKFMDARTVLFANKGACSVSAVFDYHTDANTTGWGDHTGVFQCKKSVEWGRWDGSNGKVMTQTDFARFIEDNLPDIVRPDAAHMLEVSRSLEAKSEVNFGSTVRLDNGQVELKYEEAIKGSACKGKLEIPEVFILSIAPFEGGDPVEVTARLRYRIKEGKLVIWYDLLRAHKVLEASFADVVTRITEVTKLTPLMAHF